MARAPGETVHRPRILVIEDEAELRSLWVDVLREAGCVPTAVADGAEAWRLISKKKPDLILLDLVMPEAREDGFALLGRLGGTGIPVVVISALAEALGETLGNRVAAVLPKPVAIDRLVSEVFRLVGATPPRDGR